MSEEGYVELATASNFSFLYGASHGVDLLSRALELGHAGLGIADRNTVAGVVRVWKALKDKREEFPDEPLLRDFKLVTGTRLIFADGTPDIIVYPETRFGWGRMCRLLSKGNLKADKGDCVLGLQDLLEHLDDLLLIVLPESTRRDGEGIARKLDKQTRLPEDVVEPSTTISPFPGEGRGPVKLLNSRDSADVLTHANLDVLDPGLRRGTDENDNDNVIAFPDRSPPPLTPPASGRGTLVRTLETLRKAAPDRVWLGVAMRRSGPDQRRLTGLAKTARGAQVPLLAINDVLYATPEDRPLQDVLTAIRLGITVNEGGKRFEANGERHLKEPAEMTRLFRNYPDAITQTIRFHERIAFDLEQLRYEYPHEPVPRGWMPIRWLKRLVGRAAAEKWPDGLPPKVHAMLKEEFALIEAQNIAYYFLTVHDLVWFARRQKPPILCQGRGSAANSMVCYLLGITSIDPAEHNLLFSRFLSAERNEPPISTSISSMSAAKR